MQKRVQKFFWFLFVPFVCSCSQGVSLSERESFYFHTDITTKVPTDQTSVFSAVEEVLSHFDVLTDNFTERDDDLVNVYALNHTSDPVEVDPDLAAILSYALEMEKETDGLFNPLSGNLISLWKAGIEASTPYVPETSHISQAVNEIKDTEHNYLSISGNTVQRVGVCTIDLGAIAKGFALRFAEKTLQNLGVSTYLLNAGNSSIALGEKGNSSDLWSVGLLDLSGAYLKLAKTAIGTSAITEQKAVIDGVTYSHLVNPLTGSAEATGVMAMAVGEDPALCDILSTVFMVGGLEKTQAYATKFGVSYLFYDGTTLTHSDELEVYHH
jgi:FAD:protein FMN transferase